MNKWSSKLAALTVGTTILLSSVGHASAATYTVKPGDSLAKIEKEFNISYKTIMNTNNLTSTLIFPGQQLMIGEKQGSSTIYTVKLGDTLAKIASKYSVSYKTLMEWNNLSSTQIYSGQKLIVKGGATSTTNPPATSSGTSNTSTYIVKSGDSLTKIASKYGVSYKTLMEWNNLSSTQIYNGQKLIVKGGATSTTNPPATSSGTSNTPTYIVKSGDSLTKIASKYGVSYKTLMEWNNLSSTQIYGGQKLIVKGGATSTTNPPATSSSASNISTYVVKSGDSLTKIASKYGVSYKTLMEWNNLSSSQIFVGQKLIVKGSTTSKPTSSNSSVGNKIVSIAKQYLGVKYIFGGASPSGFDCSGLITYVYNKAGISTSRLSSAGFYKAATPVSTPKIGDLVFFSNTYKLGISHVGIYIGNNKMISASDYYVQISTINDTYWKKHFTGYGRLI